jgi:chromosome segregation ATPase
MIAARIGATFAGTRAKAAILVEQVMVFSLGFLVAALGALAIAPAFWARAIRLSMRKLETRVPLSMDAVRAGRDLLRAERAVAQRGLEQKVEALSLVHAQDMAELGRRAVAVADKNAELELLREHLAALEAEKADLQHALAEATDQRDHFRAALDEARVRCSRDEAEIGELRNHLEVMQKLGANQRVALTVLERDLLHERESCAVEAVRVARLDDELRDLEHRHDAALARLRASSGGIAAPDRRLPVAKDPDAEWRERRDPRQGSSIASNPAIHREIQRLVTDLVSHQDAVDADLASHAQGRGSGRAPTEEAAVLRKRISALGTTVVRMAEAEAAAEPEA